MLSILASLLSWRRTDFYANWAVKSHGANKKRHSTNNLSTCNAKPKNLVFLLLMLWGFGKIYGCFDKQNSARIGGKEGRGLTSIRQNCCKRYPVNR